MLLGLKTIEDIIELTLYSGYIKNAEPVSLMIFAPVGAGKTEMISQYTSNKGIALLTDATAYGIIKSCFVDLKTGKLKHIIIPDLITPLSKQASTKNTFIAFLNALIEEGVVEIRTFSINEKFGGLRCGLISCIAKEAFKASRFEWRNIGFLSRCVPVSYEYPQSKVVEILYTIAKHGLFKHQKKKLELPEEPVFVQENTKLNEMIVPFSLQFQEAERVYGFRRQKQLQILMMANALRAGKTEVGDEDYQHIVKLSDYMNLNYNQVRD